MCGKFHTPLQMVHVLVAIFGGVVPNSKNIGDSVLEWLFLGKNRQNGVNQITDRKTTPQIEVVTDLI